MANAPIRPLESLSVRVITDASGFLAGMNQVTEAINAVEVRLGSFVTALNRLVTDIQNRLANLEIGLRATLGAIESAAQVFAGEMQGHWGQAFGGLIALPTVLANLAPQIGMALGGLSTIALGNLSGLTAALNGLPAAINGISNANLANLTRLVAAFGPLTGAINTLSGANFTAVETGLLTLGGALQTFVAGAANLSTVVGGLDQLAVALGRIASANVNGAARLMAGLSNITTLLPARIGVAFARIATGLDLLQSRFEAIALLSDKSAQALGRLLNALLRLSKVTAGTLTALAAEIDILTTSLAGLTAVPVEAKLIRLINALTRISAIPTTTLTSLAGLTGAINALAAALGRLPLVPPVLPAPGPVAETGRAVTSVGGAARAATVPVMNFNKSLSDMNSAARSAGAGLSFLKMGVGFFSAYSVFAAAKFDDTITKILARQGESLSSPIRGPLQKELTELAGRSLSKVNDLGNALSIIMRTGQNAGMAMQSLAQAENLATVGGENVAKSAEHLTYILRALGKEGGSVEQQLALQAKLSDMLVGVSLQTGSSVQQMAEAIDVRLGSAMRLLNISLEDAIPLLGVYSERLAKGASGGDMLARALNLLSTRAITNINFKIGMVNPFDEQGNFRLTEWLERVDKYLTNAVGKSTEAREAMLKSLGFEQRAIPAILPLLGAAPEMKALQAQLKDMDGLTKRIADSIRDSFLNQLKILWNQISLTAIAIGDRLAPAVKLLAQGLENLFGWFRNLNPAFQNLIVLAGAAYFALVPLTRLTFAALGSALNTLLAPLRMVLEIAASGLTAILNIPVLLWSAVTKLAGAFVYLGQVIGSAFSTIWSVLLTPVDILISAWKVLQNFFTNFLTGMASALTSLFTGLISLVAGLISWVFALSAALAVVVTLGAPLIAAFAAVGTAIAGAWQGIKESVGNSAAWLRNKVEEVKPVVAGMWERGKVAAGEFFVVAGGYIKALAGFFWNFGQNVEIVFVWVGKNWAELLQDMGQLAVKFVDNMIANLGAIGSFILGTAGVVWKGFWDIAGAYGKFGLTWLHNNWRILLEDLWTITKSFLVALVENFKVAFSGIGRILAESIRSAFVETKNETKLIDEIGRLEKMRDYPAMRKGTPFAKQSTESIQDSIEILEGELEKERGRRTGTIIQNIFKQFKSPLEGMGELKIFQPPVQTEQEKVLGVQPVAIRRWNKAVMDAEDAVRVSARGIADLFTTTVNTLKGPFEGFTSSLKRYTVPTPAVAAAQIAQGLSMNPLAAVAGAAGTESAFTNRLGDLLNTNLPNDFMERMLAGFRRLAAPIAGGKAPDMIGKETAGFQFKQISLQRYILGGPFAARLDAQQLNQMHLMNEKLGNIYEANKKIEENTRPKAGAGKFDINKGNFGDFPLE